MHGFLSSLFFWLVVIAASLAALLLLGLILYLLAKSIGIRRLSYSRAFSREGVCEGETVALTETVRNRSFLPLFVVDVEAYIRSDLALRGYPRREGERLQHFISRFFLLPFMQIERRHEITCLKRGYYPLETVTVRFAGTDHFFDAPAVLYVYPRPIPPETFSMFSGVLQGIYDSPRRLFPDPFSVSGVRDYEPGDPFHSINFKATARVGRLRVNNRNFSSDRRFMIYLNFNLLNDPEEKTGLDDRALNERYEKRMELGLCYASALLGLAVDAGMTAGFAANCFLVTGEQYTRFPVKGGRQHLELILREMARIRPKDGYSFARILDMDLDDGLRDANVFVFSGTFSEGVKKRIDLLRAMGNSVRLIPLD